MGFDSLVRNATKRAGIADKLTSSLQVELYHHAWSGNDRHGKPQYLTAVKRIGLVEDKKGLRQMPDGKAIPLLAKLTIFGDIAPPSGLDVNTADQREGPIDPRDKIVLVDGRTGPILETAGLIDPTTGRPYMHEVTLGRPQ